MEKSDPPVYPDIHRVADSIGRFEQRERFFRTVYEEYKRPLGTYLYRFFAQKDDRDDLYQEVLIKFWSHLQKLHKLPTTEETRKWLFTVARNQAIDQYRRQGKLNIGPLDGVEQTLYEPTLIDYQLCEQEELQWAFTNMTSQFRICLILQKVYGYSQKEIAKLLNITEKSVSANVSRGRKQFLALLDDARRKTKEETAHVDAPTR